MTRTHLWGMCALLVSASAGSTDLTRADFAYGITLQTDGLAAVYQLPVPLVVYQNTARADLGDLRVINGGGETVPYGMRRAAGEAESPGAAVALPLFPLRGASIEPSNALKLHLRADGASVEIDSPGTPASSGTVIGYLIDARGVTRAIAAINLSWDPAAADFATRARLEASDDLSHWRRLAEAPVVNLHYAGQQFLRQRLELPALPAKFIRLSWADRSPPVVITSITAEAATARTEIKRDALSAAGVAVDGQPGEYLVDLNAHVPLDRVNLQLPEINTLVSVDFDIRDERGTEWRPVAHATLYRLRTSDGSELTNPPVPIPLATASHWRIRVARDGGGLGHGSPVFDGGWLPDELVFVARGNGPFELVYGSGAAKPAAVSVQSLLPRVPAGASDTVAMPVREAKALAQVSIGGPARLKAEPRKHNWRIFALWAILVLGVGSLGWMSWRLLRQLPENPQPS